MSQGSDEIVIAEDNAVLLSVLAEIFKECGHSVRMASDGVGSLLRSELTLRTSCCLISTCRACLDLNFYLSFAANIQPSRSSR